MPVNKKKTSILKKILSYEKTLDHKIVRLLGFKMSFERRPKQSILREQISELQNQSAMAIDLMQQFQEQKNHSIDLVEQLKEQNLYNQELIKGLEGSNTQLQEQTNQTQAQLQDIQKYTQENFKEINNIKAIIDHMNAKVNWMEHPLYCINGAVNHIFRYMTGLQLTKDYQTERVVAFAPEDAPIDHLQRYSFVSQLVQSEDKVLDIACGVGYGTAMMARNAKSATGVDISLPAVNFAKKIFQQDNLNYICSDGTSFGENEKFDKIISFETIEHIENDVDFVKNLYNLLSDDGEFICSVPNQTIFPYDPKIVPFHVKHYTLEELTALLESVGFKVKDVYYQYEEENHAVMKKEVQGYTTVCIASKQG